MGQQGRNPINRFLPFLQEKTTQRLLRNAGYLFSSSGISLALGVVQSIFAARLLGVENLGLIGTVTTFASTVNRLFSFRMSELVVKYLSSYLPHKDEQKEPDIVRAGALVKAAGLAEMITSLLAFAALILLAPYASLYFAKDPAYTPLFWFYGFSILGSLVSETSTGVLQATDRFRPQAMINLIQSILTALIIFGAFLLKGSPLVVLGAYLIGKLILGIGPAVLAARCLADVLGPGWWRAPFSVLPPWKSLARFAISTNLSATVNLLVRDSELLWVAFFLDKTAVGYYKIALAIVGLVSIPIVPLINAAYPEISRNAANHAWQNLRAFLRRITLLAGAWSVGISLALAVTGRWIIQLAYGAEYIPAYPALLILLAGTAFADILFWNRPLLLSMGRPGFPLRASTICGLFKVLLSFFVIPRYGYVGAAGLLSMYFITSVMAIVVRGLGELKTRQKAAAVTNQNPL